MSSQSQLSFSEAYHKIVIEVEPSVLTAEKSKLEGEFYAFGVFADKAIGSSENQVLALYAMEMLTGLEITCNRQNPGKSYKQLINKLCAEPFEKVDGVMGAKSIGSIDLDAGASLIFEGQTEEECIHYWLDDALQFGMDSNLHLKWGLKHAYRAQQASDWFYEGDIQKKSPFRRLRPVIAVKLPVLNPLEEVKKDIGSLGRYKILELPSYMKL